MATRLLWDWGNYLLRENPHTSRTISFSIMQIARIMQRAEVISKSI